MKYLIAIFFLGASVFASAEGWTSKFMTVKSVFTEGKTDLIVVYTENGQVETSGCLANQWIIDADNESRRSRIYSTLLTALSTGQKVKFWFKDTCASWNYHKASVVQVYRPGIGSS